MKKAISLICRQGLCLAGLFPLCLALAEDSVEQSFGARFADPVGDFKQAQYGDFDIVGLELLSNGTDQVTVVFETHAPIAAQPEHQRSWYGLYFDMDRDGTTGLGMSGNGYDVVFAIEAKGNQWEATAAPVSSFAKRLKFTASDLKIEGTKGSFTITSKAFEDYPAPIVGVWTHRAGKFLDDMESLDNLPVQLFTGKLNAEGRFAFTMKKSVQVGGGRYSRSILPIDDKTRGVTYDIEVKKRNDNQRWRSTVELRLYDANEKRQVSFGVAESLDDDDESAVQVEIAKEDVLDKVLKRPYRGRYLLKLVFNESGGMDFFLDDALIYSHPKEFSISEANFFVCGTDADVKITIQ